MFRPKTLSRLQLLSSKVFLDGFFTAVEGIMKTILLAVLLAMSTAHFAARADVSARLTTDGDGVKEFRLAIGTHFGIKERAITEVRKDIPDSELPVVFHIASKAKVSPGAIVALRRQKKSWLDVTLHFGLSPEIFHVPVTKVPGPPYGRAYGYFRNKPKSGWGKIKLKDDEIVHLVNVKFLSSHHRRSPDDVLRMNRAGRSFVKLHGTLNGNKSFKARVHNKRVEKQDPPAVHRAKKTEGSRRAKKTRGKEGSRRTKKTRGKERSRSKKG